jgi:hypothetical protein
MAGGLNLPIAGSYGGQWNIFIPGGWRYSQRGKKIV